MLSAVALKGRICTAMYKALEHVILDQIRTVTLGETIDNHIPQYFEANKVTEALEKMLSRNEEFLVPIASPFQTKIMDPITDQQGVDVFGSMSMSTGAKKDATVAAEARLVHDAQARTSSKSSSKESYGGGKSCRSRHFPRSRTPRIKNNKPDESDSIWSVSDIDPGKNPRRSRHGERLNISDSNSNHSSIEIDRRLIRRKRH